LIRDTRPLDTGLKKYMGSYDIVVYPNPAHTKLNIHGMTDGAEVSLINCLGEVVLNLFEPDGDFDFDIFHLPSGLYYLKLESSQYQAVFKVVKQ
jgi:hypothetical protein